MSVNKLGVSVSVIVAVKYIRIFFCKLISDPKKKVTLLYLTT